MMGSSSTPKDTVGERDCGANRLELFPIEVDRRKALALCLSEHLCPTRIAARSDDALDRAGSRQCRQPLPPNIKPDADDQGTGEVGRTLRERTEARPALRDMLHAECRDDAGRHHGDGKPDAETQYQRDAKGDGARFPPLAATNWVSGNKQRLISVVVHGLSGEIEVEGRRFNDVMPAHGFLSDDQIAQVLTYLRQNFGNYGQGVLKDEVAAARTRGPWTPQSQGQPRPGAPQSPQSPSTPPTTPPPTPPPPATQPPPR